MDIYCHVRVAHHILAGGWIHTSIPRTAAYSLLTAHLHCISGPPFGGIANCDIVINIVKQRLGNSVELEGILLKDIKRCGGVLIFLATLAKSYVKYNYKRASDIDSTKWCRAYTRDTSS